MIFIPLMADQPVVAKRGEDLGLGIRLDKNSLTSEQIQNAAYKILSDRSYYMRLKEHSNTSRKYEGAIQIRNEIIELIQNIG